MLQNLCLDFAMLGDLTLVERHGVYAIAHHGLQSIQVTIKVLSFIDRFSQTLISPFACLNGNRRHLISSDFMYLLFSEFVRTRHN